MLLQFALLKPGRKKKVFSSTDSATAPSAAEGTCRSSEWAWEGNPPVEYYLCPSFLQEPCSAVKNQKQMGLQMTVCVKQLVCVCRQNKLERKTDTRGVLFCFTSCNRLKHFGATMMKWTVEMDSRLLEKVIVLLQSNSIQKLTHRCAFAKIFLQKESSSVLFYFLFIYLSASSFNWLQ